MIYRFTIISDEVDDFIREIKIAPDATFFDFHNAILDSVNFEHNQMASFFTCDDDWEKETEITLEEMDSNPETDSWIMSETPLNKLIEDEKQKLLYVFDYLTERCFFIELSEIITGKDIKKPVCTRSEGTPPPQSVDFEEAAATSGISQEIKESYFDDQFIEAEELELDDFDLDGYDQGTEDLSDDDRY